MEVIVYEIGEIVDGECVEDALMLSRELGIDGYEEKRIPFEPMSPKINTLVNFACEIETELKSYKYSIPLKILEIAKEYRDLFDKIVIRRSSSVKDDPFLIGIKNNVRFLLGRWGEELEDFSVLEKKATLYYCKKMKRECLEILAQVKGAIDSVTEFGIDLKSEPYVYFAKSGF